jgi:hypothetical protein
VARHRCRRACAAAALLAAMLGGVPARAAQVPQVQPSADHVPANLLRISLSFAQPVDGNVLSRLALVRADGSAIEAPFLPQELWSPDGAILTLLLHPGRVKTGLQARAALGPILSAGETVTLTFDGRPLRTWQVDADDTEGPDVAAWRIAPVGAGSRQSLAVVLDAPVDGRAAGHIGIADASGRRVPGKAVLGSGEDRWIFTPGRPWRPGRYRLVVSATLEDAAGNRPHGRFETAPGAGVEPAADQVRDFTVEAPARVQGRRRRLP